ncbi:hypothetical protein [Leucobacter luti]|uniref:hypothetical protein n=1 Tax=Leucobacter luti TaxID=340320 RepID=UPI003D03DE53
MSFTRIALASSAVVALASVLLAAPHAPALGDSPPVDPAAIEWGVLPSTPEGPDGRGEFSFQVAPGTVITDWVSVSNLGANPGSFRVYAADATVDYGTGAFTLIGSDRASRDLGSWTALDGAPSSCPPPSEAPDGGSAAGDDAAREAEAVCAAGLGVTVDLGPGERADIPFTISVPADAPPGDHAAGIVASFASEPAEGGIVRREDRVGTRVHVRVDGPLSPGIGIVGPVAGFDAAVNPFAGGTGRVAFEVANRGNTRVSALPSVRLSGPFGIELGTLQLPPIEDLVPGAVTRVSPEFPGVPPLLLLFAEITVTPIPASGLAATDPLPAPATAEVTAWALPWPALLAVLVLALGIAATVWRRRYVRARLAEELASFADRIREERDTARDPAPTPGPDAARTPTFTHTQRSHP